MPVAVPDPFTGQTRKLNFDADDLGTVARLSSYSSEESALLPLVLDEAQAHANFNPLAGLMLQVTHCCINTDFAIEFRVGWRWCTYTSGVQ